MLERWFPDEAERDQARALIRHRMRVTAVLVAAAIVLGVVVGLLAS